MKASPRANLVHTLFAVAAFAALSVQAAPDYFEQQRQITDGYYPQYNVAPRVTRPESARTAAENDWFVRERIADSNGSKPQQFVPPASTSVAVNPHSLAGWIERAGKR
jgi:hypothetical protein